MIRKTLYTFAALVALLSLAALISAQDKKVTLTGYVVDKMCSAGTAKKDDVMAAAANHPKGCALKEKCLSSGLGVFADGKYYEFDSKGTEMAKGLLEKSSKETGIKVNVEGTTDGTKLMVSKITEAGG
jgi:hypothetical protein